MVLGSLGSAVAFADENTPGENDKYDIVLTKIKMDDLSGWPKKVGVDGTNYTGQKLTIADYFGDSATTLQGAYFEVRKETATGDIVAEGITNASGEITFTNLPAGKYVIVENKEKSEIPENDELAEAAAVPMEIELPVYKATGGWYTTGNNAVHVYPKNTVDKPSIDKVVNENDKDDTALIGEEKTFKITSKMPQGIEDYKVLTFTDKFSAGLSYAGGLNVTFTTGNPATTTPISETAYDVLNGASAAVGQPAPGTKEAIIVVKFKEAYIKTLKAGDIITITYKATINEDAIMGGANPNDVTLKYGTNSDENKQKETVPPENPELHTGGKRFEKVDAATSAKLAGAKFVVKNAAGKFLKQTLTDGNVTKTEWVDSQAEATTFTSAADGSFEVKGLPYGTVGQAASEGSTDYFLVETKAPEGYALLTAPIPFTVDAKSYQADPTDLSAGFADPQKVNNNKITIPQTGGIGSVAIVAAGMLVAGLGLMLKRRMAK
jgi:fimbrial isopeptide formation D2 family protein/LPXTG-motif cell wall-anchored protein